FSIFLSDWLKCPASDGELLNPQRRRSPMHEAPSPWPLSQPWSPVGYNVVQVADENAPAGGAPAAPAAAAPAKPARCAKSPAGYRVVQVGDEQVPPAPRPAAHKPLTERRLPPPLRPRHAAPAAGPVVWAALAIGGVLLVGTLVLVV